MKKILSVLLPALVFSVSIMMASSTITSAEETEQIFTLSCKTKKVNVDTITEENNRVLFTATCSNETITSIELVNENSNTVVATLLDDGDITVSGDSYKDDSEFSGYLDISDYSVDDSGMGTYSYYAQYTDRDGKIQKSNSIKIAVYRSFTDEELEIMNQTDMTIQELVNSKEYNDANSETRYTLICNVLKRLIEEGLVREYSSEYPKNPTISFIYNVIGNVMGTVSYIDSDPNTDSDYSGLKYEANDDHVVITGYTKELPEDVVIPAFIENLPVTEIGDNAFTSSSIQTVTLEGNVKTIGYSVFGMCTSLREVTLCNTVEKIGDYTFMGDSALEKVTLSSGLTELPSGTFYYCKSLGEIIIPEGVVNLGEGAFSSSKIQSLTLPTSLESIDNLCFASTKIEALIVKNPTCAFGDNVFEYNKTEMTIYGYNNSTAQRYALDNDIKFVTLPDDMVMGDVNGDGTFNIVDVIQFQKWLLNVPNTTLNNWVAADLCADGKLNVFDLCLMKRMLLQ